jgi:hypothetical protein
MYAQEEVREGARRGTMPIPVPWLTGEDTLEPVPLEEVVCEEEEIVLVVRGETGLGFGRVTELGDAGELDGLDSVGEGVGKTLMSSGCVASLGISLVRSLLWSGRGGNPRSLALSIESFDDFEPFPLRIVFSSS